MTKTTTKANPSNKTTIIKMFCFFLLLNSSRSVFNRKKWKKVCGTFCIVSDSTIVLYVLCFCTVALCICTSNNYMKKKICAYDMNTKNAVRFIVRAKLNCPTTKKALSKSKILMILAKFHRKSGNIYKICSIFYIF